MNTSANASSFSNHYFDEQEEDDDEENLYPTSFRSTTVASFLDSRAGKEPAQTTSVSALVDEEEALVSSYREAVQQNFHILTEESSFLDQIEKEVDYDIEIYAENLRMLLEKKLHIFESLHSKLINFQSRLQAEEQYVAQRT